MPRRFRVHVPQLTPGTRELSGDTLHYVTRVHRVVPGEHFTAFDPEAALECDATLVRSADGRLLCDLGEPRAASLTGALPVTLFHVPGKTDRGEEVVRAATALGVRAVHLVHSERSVFVASEKHRERLRLIAIDGARQSGRGDLPRIEGPSDLARAVRGSRAFSVRLCLHPRAEASLHTRLETWAPPADVALLVGPEGGFSDAELETIRAASFELAAMGPLTLRSELAAIAAMGALASRLVP